MSSKSMIAGMLLAAATPAMADVPAGCLSVANYAAQALDLRMGDAYTGGGTPDSVSLKADFAGYPVTASRALGDCGAPGTHFPAAWCKVAGGMPSVFQVEVSKSDSQGGVAPFADVVVTFNRGGCWVDSATRK